MCISACVHQSIPSILDTLRKICFSALHMTVDFTDAVKWYLAFLFSTVFHEAAHAWTAQKLGDDTAARGGQVTLDPTPHIRREPLGMVVVPLISFFSAGWMLGWASAPYDRQWAVLYPRRAALMALAGPAANLLLVAASAVLMLLGIQTGFFDPATSISFTHVVDAGQADLSYFAARCLSILFSLNLLLACLNLIPLPPLDGSNAPLLFLPENLARGWMRLTAQPGLRMIGLLVIWNGFGRFFPPVHAAAVHLLFPVVR